MDGESEMADDTKRDASPAERDDVLVIPDDYRLTIPRAVRELPGFQPGKKVVWLVKGGSVSLVPVLGLDKLRGIARGIDTSNIREKVDRF